MKQLRIFSVLSTLVVSLFAVVSLASAQGGQRQSGDAFIGGLIDVVVNNTQALNDVSVLNNSLNNALNNNNVRVLNINDTLNGNQVNVLSNILNNSDVLSNNQTVIQNVLNNNDVAKNFLNQNNVAVDRVIAVDVLSAPFTLYVFNPS